MKTLEFCRQPLSKLARITPGYPFRGKLPLDDDGDVFVVQFRHLVDGEHINDRQGKILDRAMLSGRKKPDYLRHGDVLFMAKGTRNDAAVVGDVPNNTVCTPSFYHIRLEQEAAKLLPEFLAWQLNYIDAQRYFSTSSQGSLALSITKAQLGNLPIVIPPIEKQKLMVRLADAATQERRLMSKLTENRQRMVDAAGHQLFSPDTTTRK